MVEVLETPAADVSFDYGDGVLRRNVTPGRRQVGVYLGYKLSSRPGLVFNGIAAAGSAIGVLVVLSSLAGSN